MDRRTALLGIGGLFSTALMGCGSKKDPTTTSTANVKQSSGSQPIAKAPLDPVKEFLEQNFYLPLSQDIRNAGDDKKKIFEAVVNRVNDTLEKTVHKFSVVDAQPQLRETYRNIQIKVLQELLSSAQGYLTKAQIIQNGNLDQLVSYGIYFNHNLIDKFNTGALIILEDQKLNTDNAPLKLFIPIIDKKTFDINSLEFSQVKTFFDELGLRPIKPIEYIVLDSPSTTLYGGVSDGQMMMNLHPFKRDEQELRKDFKKHFNAVLVNEALHKAMRVTYGDVSKPINPDFKIDTATVNSSREAEEFLSDVATAIIFPETILEKIDRGTNVQYTFSRNMIFGAAMDLLERRTASVYDRRSYAQMGAQKVIADLKIAYGDEFQTKFLKEFQTELIAKAKKVISLF